MPHVLVTYRRVPGAGLLERLRERFLVTVNPAEGQMPREGLFRAVADADAMVSMLTDRVDAELLDAAPRLKVVANYAVGFNNVDVQAATERGIMVTNTPDVVTDATADLAWAILMGIARNVCVVDRFTRSGRWTEWRPEAFIAADITGATLGIVGMGRIGQAVAKRAAGFDMRILYYDVRQATPEIEQRWGAHFISLDTLLRESDFVTVHVPLFEATRHLIDARALSLMKPTAYLVNAARGPIVDEQALVRALQAGTIAGAALDVYENEPRLADGLAQLDNAILIPHLGANSRRTRDRMAAMTVDNIVAALSRETPPNLVNSEVLSRRRPLAVD
ncbi:MAG: D-glycerate dehydrogenase [Dehalococcoidia bacterium]|jgi:glyoxylate reductase|nr:D-glycerate dehydrogenase [Dehalococcoidia bacterium]